MIMGYTGSQNTPKSAEGFTVPIHFIVEEEALKVSILPAF